MFFTGPLIDVFHPTAGIARRDQAATAAVRRSHMNNTQPLSHRQTHRPNDTCPLREEPAVIKLLELSRPCIFTYQNCSFVTHFDESQNPSEIPPLTIHNQKVHSDHRRHRRLRLSNHNLRRWRNACLLQGLHVTRFRPLVSHRAHVPSAGVPSGYGEANSGDGGGGSGASVHDQFGVPASGHGGKKFGDSEFFEIVALRTIRELKEKKSKKLGR